DSDAGMGPAAQRHRQRAAGAGGHAGGLRTLSADERPGSALLFGMRGGALGGWRGEDDALRPAAISRQLFRLAVLLQSIHELPGVVGPGCAQSIEAREQLLLVGLRSGTI